MKLNGTQEDLVIALRECAERCDAILLRLPEKPSLQPASMLVVSLRSRLELLADSVGAGTLGGSQS